MRSKRSEMVAVNGEELRKAVYDSGFSMGQLDSACSVNNGHLRDATTNGRINRAFLNRVCAVIKEDPNSFIISANSNNEFLRGYGKAIDDVLSLCTHSLDGHCFAFEKEIADLCEHRKEN